MSASLSSSLSKNWWVIFWWAVERQSTSLACGFWVFLRNLLSIVNSMEKKLHGKGMNELKTTRNTHHHKLIIGYVLLGSDRKKHFSSTMRAFGHLAKILSTFCCEMFKRWWHGKGMDKFKAEQTKTSISISGLWQELLLLLFKQCSVLCIWEKFPVHHDVNGLKQQWCKRMNEIKKTIRNVYIHGVIIHRCIGIL